VRFFLLSASQFEFYSIQGLPKEMFEADQTLHWNGARVGDLTCLFRGAR